MTVRPDFRPLTVTVLLAVGLLAAAGCAEDTTPLPPSTATAKTAVPGVLVERVDASYADAGSPSGDVPELDLDDECPLEVELTVAGAQPRGFGAGVSGLGDSGHRVVCDGTDPSVTLSVGHLDDPAEFAELESEVGPQQEVGNEQTGSTEMVDGRTVIVVRTVYPTNDSHIDYTATVTDPTSRAYAVYQIETTGDARQTYSSAQAARDLSAVLDSAE